MPFYLPPLYPIIDVDSCTDPLAYAKTLFSCGVSLVQLRAKTMFDKDFVILAKQVVALAKESPDAIAVIINDRIDICLLSGAAGVHVGQDDVSPAEVRKQLGDEAIVGFSTHTKEQFEAAPYDALSYIALGPIFATSSKRDASPVVGVEALAALAPQSPLPLVAIGGITAENAKEVYTAGAGSIAVISDLQNAADIPARVQTFYSAAKLISSE